VSSLEDLRRIAATVEPIRGWDFSRVLEVRDPVPWEYPQVVRRFLKPTDQVLDIATGGGEVFLSLASAFGSGVGTDVSAEMIATARENKPPDLREKVSFEVMAAQDLELDGETFDLVLNRHGPVFVAPIMRVLKPGGYFICQQVGGLNTQNVFQLFGCESSGAYWRRYWDEHGFEHQDLPSLVRSFSAAGCRTIASGSYNVDYTFLERPDFEGAKYVYTPPPRAKENQDVLWNAVRTDTLSAISTDHCAFLWDGQKSMGKDDFSKIPNGGPGLENRLQMIHEFGARAGRISLNRMVELLATSPAKLFGLYPRKGTIAVGSDADIVVFDPEKKVTISAKTQHSKTDYNLYEGTKVTGTPEVVLLRGQILVEGDELLAEPGVGRFVARAKFGQELKPERAAAPA